ncbi:C-type lectin domain-containing protein, partial [bacterium AH-315-E10]|nr:C-type lectin domain-containing protein [bacterium AH-315-E10]
AKGLAMLRLGGLFDPRNNTFLLAMGYLEEGTPPKAGEHVNEKKFLAFMLKRADFLRNQPSKDGRLLALTYYRVLQTFTYEKDKVLLGIMKLKVDGIEGDRDDLLNREIKPFKKVKKTSTHKKTKQKKRSADPDFTGNWESVQWEGTVFRITRDGNRYHLFQSRNKRESIRSIIIDGKLILDCGVITVLLEKKGVTLLYTLYKSRYTGEMPTGVIKWNKRVLTRVKIPDDAIKWKGHRYKRIPILMSWESARIYCQLHDGHLATITSQKENDFIEKHWSTVHSWIGGRVKNGKWHWENGERFSYTNWFPGGFDKAGSCMLFNKKEKGHSGKWSSVDDAERIDIPGFICEWDK